MCTVRGGQGRPESTAIRATIRFATPAPSTSIKRRIASQYCAHCAPARLMIASFQGRDRLARRILLLCATGLLLHAGVALSTTVLPVSFDELVSKAELIFVGEVIDRRSVYDTGPDRPIVTHVTFDVLRVLKGSAGLRTQLTFLGGRVGQDALVVAGMPRFEIGDRDMLFVSADRNAVSPLVGFWQGRFRIVLDAETGVEVVHTHAGGAVFSGFGRSIKAGVSRSAALAAAPHDSSLSLNDFAALVRSRINTAAGR